MSTLPLDRIRELLEPYAALETKLGDELVSKFSTYLDLLVRWNAKVSLTAIRQPEEIVRRHFGESLFTGSQLAGRLADGSELLDYGSGAGFPGLPIQILLPRLKVTLAESQARKVAFLREVIRVVELDAEVWPRRVDEMPSGRRFNAVTLRAVDRMAISLEEATGLLQDGGWLAALVGRDVGGEDAEEYLLPGSENRRLLLWQSVPRGTSAE